MEVLIVCSGNIIRSPLAAGLLVKTLDEIGVKGVIVSSAGTLGIDGHPADPEAVRIARGCGFDLRTHRSRPLTARDVARADLIVGMEEAHVRAIVGLDPSAASRASILTEFDGSEKKGKGWDIIDPIGGPRDAFETCFSVIERCVENLAFRLKYRHGP